MRVPSFSASTAQRAATVAAMGFGIVASFQLRWRSVRRGAERHWGAPTRELSRPNCAS